MKRVNAQQRRVRFYRSISTKAAKARQAVQLNGDGSLKRGEGRGNFGYEVRKGSKPSILRDCRVGYDKDGVLIAEHEPHGKKPYPCPNHDAVAGEFGGPPPREVFEALGRDDLRTLAKAAGVKGWGKMSKAQMIDGLLA